MKKLLLIVACSAAVLNVSWAAAPFGQMMSMHYRLNDNRTIVVPKTGNTPTDTTKASPPDGGALIATEPSGIAVLMPTRPRVAVLMPTRPRVAVLMPTRPRVAVLMPTRPSRIALLMSTKPGGV